MVICFYTFNESCRSQNNRKRKYKEGYVISIFHFVLLFLLIILLNNIYPTLSNKTFDKNSGPSIINKYAPKDKKGPNGNLSFLRFPLINLMQI